MLKRECQTVSLKTWSRAGIRCQQVGEVGSKSLHDTTNGEIGQATLPMAERGPALQEENVSEGYPRAQRYTESAGPQTDSSTREGGLQSGMRDHLALWPLLIQHKQSERCRFVLGVEFEDCIEAVALVFEVLCLSCQPEPGADQEEAGALQVAGHDLGEESSATINNASGSFGT
jgi:hypothetical protein